MNNLIPKKIILKNNGKLLVIDYVNNQFDLTAEYLRVCSPSAEVRGHGDWQLVAGKKEVFIVKIVPVGQYAIRPAFSDGHISGIYSWNVLYDLCVNYQQYWQEYLEKLIKSGKSREKHWRKR